MRRTKRASGGDRGRQPHSSQPARAAGTRTDAPTSADKVISLQQSAGNRAVTSLLSGHKKVAGPLRVSRQPTRTQAAPDTAALKGQLEERAHELLGRFNFEMNTLQNNLGMVAAVINTGSIPKFDFFDYFKQRLVSEGLEAIPFGPVAEGLKIAWDVFIKYRDTAKAAKAMELRNQIQVFTATKHNDLEVQQAAFAVLHDMLLSAANSGVAARMIDALKVAPDPRSLGDIVKEGVAYRVALNQAFLAQFVQMRTLVYDPGRLRGEVLGPISATAMRSRIRDEGPQYHLAGLSPTGPGGQGAGGWALRRWMTPTNEHMAHLLAGVAGGGAGLSYDELNYWYRTQPKVRSEVRYAGTRDPSYPQHELHWLFGS